MASPYTPTQRAEAVALAAAVGPAKAAEQLGIPRRTVSYWMHQPAQSAVIAAAEQDIADSLRSAHKLALAEVTAGLRNPKARLGDKAQALRILGDQLALSEGRATENIAINDGASKVDNPVMKIDPEGAEYLERIINILMDMDFETLLAIQEGRIEVRKAETDVG